MLPNVSGLLQTPASDLRTPQESLRSLFGGELEMRFGGNPIEGSNPSLSATPIDGGVIKPHALPADVSTWHNATVASRMLGTSCRQRSHPVY